jgi:hypothetical protein
VLPLLTSPDTGAAARQSDNTAQITRTVVAANTELLCPAGHSCPGGNILQPEPCQPGTYAEEGARKCTTCPGGYISSGYGVTACSSCGNSFSSPDGQTCRRTPAGYYSTLFWGGGLAPLWGGDARSLSSLRCSGLVSVRGGIAQEIPCPRRYLCTGGSELPFLCLPDEVSRESLASWSRHFIPTHACTRMHRRPICFPWHEAAAASEVVLTPRSPLQPHATCMWVWVRARVCVRGNGRCHATNSSTAFDAQRTPSPTMKSVSASPALRDFTPLVTSANRYGAATGLRGGELPLAVEGPGPTEPNACLGFSHECR